LFEEIIRNKIKLINKLFEQFKFDKSAKCLEENYQKLKLRNRRKLS